MSDDANPASNAETSEAVSADTPVQTEQQTTQVETTEKPAASAREAVERAIAKVTEAPVEAKQEPERKLRNPNKDPETGKFTSAPKQDTKPAETKPTQVEVKPDTKPAQQPPAYEAWKPGQPAPEPSAEDLAKTPNTVRAFYDRRHHELMQGVEKYRGIAEPVAKFHDMAIQSGTTLDKALDAYVGIETAWRQNPTAGFNQVCRNMGVSPNQMLQAIVQGYQQNGGIPQIAQPSPQPNQEIAALKEQLSQIQKGLSESQQQQRQGAALQTVEAFAKDHPHFDVVADDIAKMLETGYAKDLPDAYALAIRLNPEVAARIEAEKKPAVDPAQTREKAAKSITGSPATGAHPDATPKPAGSPREALQRAMAQVGV